MGTLWKKYSYVMMFIVITFLLGLYMIFTMIDDSKPYQQIKVSEGQSLWELANMYADDHSLSPNDFIKWVAEKNHLNENNIKAGDTIIIPVKVKYQINDNSKLAYDME